MILVPMGFMFTKWHSDAALRRVSVTKMQGYDMKSNKKKAFTLIELLVVVSIIALLVSILLPSLSKAREQARAVVCASNMRQWALYISVYAGDTEGFLPGMKRSGGPGLGVDEDWWFQQLLERGWAEFGGPVPDSERELIEYGLGPYKMTRCPSRHSICAPSWEGFPELVYDATYVSWMNPRTAGHPNTGIYGFNGGLAWKQNVHDGTSGHARMSRIEKPAECMLLIDSICPFGDRWGWWTYWGNIPHDGSTNVLFADSHVDRAPLARVPALQTDTAYWAFWYGADVQGNLEQP